MVRGHPDYQTLAGRSVGGGRVTASSFSGNILSGTIGVIDFPNVAANIRHALIQLNVSCPDDTAIHTVKLIRVSDNWLFMQVEFVSSLVLPINSVDLEEGNAARLSITNNSSSTLNFSGTISWVEIGI